MRLNTLLGALCCAPLALGLVVGLGACAAAPGATAMTREINSEILVVEDYDGRTHDLNKHLEAGEPVVLVFWQTWCKSCIAEAPALAEIARSNPKLHFVGVIPGAADTSDVAEVRSVATKLDLPYPQIMDRDLALTKGLAITGTPTIVVLGTGGEVLHTSHRADLPWSALAR